MSIGSLPGPTSPSTVTRDFRAGYPRGQRGRVPKLHDESRQTTRFIVHLMKKVGCSDKCVQRNIVQLRLLSFQQLVQWSLCVTQWSDDQWKLFSDWSESFDFRSSQKQREPRLGNHPSQKDYIGAQLDSRDQAMDPCNVYEPHPYQFLLPNGVFYTSGGRGYEWFDPEEDDEETEVPTFPPDSPPASGGAPGVGGGTAAGTYLWFTNLPLSVTVGGFLAPFQVAQFDRDGNPVTGIDGTVSLVGSSDIAGVLSVPMVDGIATFFGVQALVVGSLAFAASAPYFTTAYSDSVTVIP